MISDNDYIKNKQTLVALRGIVNGIRVLEKISDSQHESLILAVDSLSFCNEQRDAERYLTEIERFEKLYTKMSIQ